MRIYFFNTTDLFSRKFYLFMYLLVYVFIYLGQRDGFGTATMITAQLWSSCPVVVDGHLELLLFIIAEQTSVMTSSVNSLKYKVIINLLNNI